MASWILEPGHTEAEFRARHMMVTWVRGLFKDIHGKLELDFERCTDATFEGEIDATGIWTGQPERDMHLRSADFFDVENHPTITFAGRLTEQTGGTTFKGEAQLTIRGITRTAGRAPSRRRRCLKRDRAGPRRGGDPARGPRAVRCDPVLPRVIPRRDLTHRTYLGGPPSRRASARRCRRRARSSSPRSVAWRSASATDGTSRSRSSSTG